MWSWQPFFAPFNLGNLPPLSQSDALNQLLESYEGGDYSDGLKILPNMKINQSMPISQAFK